MSKEIRVDIEDEIVAAMKRRIEAGEFSDASAAVSVALRYYFERHQEKEWAEYVEQEIAWSRRNAGR